MRKIFSPSKKNIFKASVLGLSLTFCNVNPTVVFQRSSKALAFAYQNNLIYLPREQTFERLTKESRCKVRLASDYYI